MAAAKKTTEKTASGKAAAPSAKKAPVKKVAPAKKVAVKKAVAKKAAPAKKTVAKKVTTAKAASSTRKKKILPTPKQSKELRTVQVEKRTDGRAQTGEGWKREMEKKHGKRGRASASKKRTKK